MKKFICIAKYSRSEWRLFGIHKKSLELTGSVGDAINRINNHSKKPLKVQVTNYKPHRYDIVLKITSTAYSNKRYKDKNGHTLSFCTEGLNMAFGEIPNVIYIKRI